MWELLINSENVKVKKQFQVASYKVLKPGTCNLKLSLSSANDIV